MIASDARISLQDKIKIKKALWKGIIKADKSIVYFELNITQYQQDFYKIDHRSFSQFEKCFVFQHPRKTPMLGKMITSSF